MLSCRDLAHRHASDYIDGNLGLRARFGVWYHLLICENCRRFVAQLRRVRNILRNKPRIPVTVPEEIAAQQELGEHLAALYEQRKKSPPSL